MKRIRILMILGASILVISSGAGGRGVAYAQSLDSYCTLSNICMNAWNGGPYIEVYNNPNVANDNFDVNNFSIFFGSTTGKYALACIGDAGNSPTDARAALDPGNGEECPNAAPWGGVFLESVCSLPNGTDGVSFYDYHWKGYLAPAGDGNGDAFYLNNPNTFCFA